MAQQKDNNKYIDQPATIITAEDYEEKLNVLPPCGWNLYGGIEMFYVSEAITSNIHSWYAKESFLSIEEGGGSKICKHFYQTSDATIEELMESYDSVS